MGVLKPLVAILKGHCIASQMKAALAIGCICEHNLGAQLCADKEKAPSALCRLFQVCSIKKENNISEIKNQKSFKISFIS